MRGLALSTLAAVLAHTTAAREGYSLFVDPFSNRPRNPLLVERQTCPLGYNLCSSINVDNACCPSDTNCTYDDAGHVACCPFNTVCTGTIAGTITGSTTPTLTDSTSSSAFVITSTITATPTTSFQSITSIASVPTTGVAGGGSTVPNQYFPFVYIPTSYANAGLCSTYWTSCQAESTSCLVSLAGANGVTVGGFGQGITVQGSTGTVLSAASSICSSLSMQACYGLQLQRCNQLSGGANAAPRMAACPCVMYIAGAGAVLGAMGVMA